MPPRREVLPEWLSLLPNEYSSENTDNTGDSFWFFPLPTRTHQLEKTVHERGQKVTIYFSSTEAAASIQKSTVTYPHNKERKWVRLFVPSRNVRPKKISVPFQMSSPPEMAPANECPKGEPVAVGDLKASSLWNA